MTNEEAIKVLTHVMMVAKAMDDTNTGLALTRAIEVLRMHDQELGVCVTKEAK